MRLFITGFSILLLFLIGAIFALYNPQIVQFHYIVSSIELPLAVLQTICLAIGIFLGWLVGSWQHLRLRYHIRQLQQANQQIATELSRIQRS